MMRRLSLPALLLLAGCASTAPPGIGVPPAGRTGGHVADPLGMDAPGLIRAFGTPALDVQEGPGRKLQFGNATCVLDAYLYAPRPGGKPVVTYAETRDRQGGDVARAPCLASLQHR